MASGIAKKFPCPEHGCTKSFTRKATLQHHLDGPQHANQRPFQCPDCPARFVRKGDQKKHEERKHQHLTRFVCGASSCSAAYATRHELNRHLKRFPEHIQEGNPSVFVQEMTVSTVNWNPRQNDIDAHYEEQSSRLLVGCGGWTEFAAVPEGKRVQVEQMKDGCLVAELPIMSLESDGMSPARSTGTVKSLQPWVALVAFGLTGGHVSRGLPLTAESNSSAPLEAQGALQQLMQSVRRSWKQYDFSDLEVNLDLLYTKLVNRFRSHRGQGVGVLEHEQHVTMLLRETYFESLTERRRIERRILIRLDLHTNQADMRSLEEIEKDLPYWRIWDELAQISDAQEQRAQIQREMRMLVQQERQRLGHPCSGVTLTLEWLEESIQCALMARAFCKSIASEHTSSVMETVRSVE